MIRALIKLCTSSNHYRVEYPADSVGALESNDHIHVEQDAEVTTQ